MWKSNQRGWCSGEPVISSIIIITIYIQAYIVTGGVHHGRSKILLDSTEILKKEGGTSWQKAASLPSARRGLRGVSLPNGHFMVSGEDRSTSTVY